MKIKTISFAIGSALLSAPLMAAESAIWLAPVQGFVEPSSGKISAASIARRIGRDDTLVNLLRETNGVRFAADADNSQTMGEIAPANVSFYGERYYSNAFTINGISINDNVNPAGMGENGRVPFDHADTISPDTLPIGHAQAFWVSPAVLEEVDVRSDNVSSQFGGFTGGAVDARLKSPDASRASGSVSYRTTRSAWTQFYLDGNYQKDFEEASNPLAQPKFVKHAFNVTLNQPVSQDAAVLLSYDRQQSSIPEYQQNLKGWVKQQRRSENLLLAYQQQLNAQHALFANVLYAPHSGSYFLDNARDGRFVESGGGWIGEIGWDFKPSWGTLRTDISYRSNVNQTAYDADTLYRYIKTPSIDWVSIIVPYGDDEATKGGIGKRRTKQTSLAVKQDLALQPLQWGASSHRLKAGWSFERNTSSVLQEKGAQQFYGAVDADYRQDPNDPSNWQRVPFTDKNCTACIPGEQYFKFRADYGKINGGVSHHRAGVYLEDEILWGDWLLRPGVRADYTQFTDKIDVAPRFLLDYNVLGKGAVHLTFGANRYYGGDLVEHKLRSHIQFSDEYMRDGADAPWESLRRNSWVAYRPSQLKTPYSDEITADISQQAGNSLWKFDWVRRYGRDQFMTVIDYNQNPQERRLVNQGRHQTDSFSLEVHNITPIATDWASFDWAAGANYQRSKTNQRSDYTQRS